MNSWTQMSVDYANQMNYLDRLYSVYTTVPEGIRDLHQEAWDDTVDAFDRNDNKALIRSLLKQEHFPIKDSYVAFLRRDPGAIDRNPETVNRLCGRIYEMGLPGVFERCSEPKETNRQIGPLFRKWIRKGSLGLIPVSLDEFQATSGNAVLEAGDVETRQFAAEHLNYRDEKGLDLLARFNGRHIIGEAKFLTDFGGHQNAQFNDAMNIFQHRVRAIRVAILDGVCYLENSGKMFTAFQDNEDNNIMSALVLREFLYQV